MKTTNINSTSYHFFLSLTHGHPFLLEAVFTRDLTAPLEATLTLPVDHLVPLVVASPTTEGVARVRPRGVPVAVASCRSSHRQPRVPLAEGRGALHVQQGRVRSNLSVG